MLKTLFSNSKLRALWPWLLLSIFTVIHFLALPLVITFDGHLYLDQALMLGTDRFWTDWHFLRTPLLQSITRLGFSVVGPNAELLVFINTVLGVAGLGVLYAILTRWLKPVAASCVVLLVGVNPLFVTYQHTFLTEMGSFFFLGLSCFALLRLVDEDFSWSSATLFGLTAALGYYFRPTLFMVAPIGFIAVLWSLLAKRRLKPLFVLFVCMVVVPYLFTLPWRSMGKGRNWEDDQVGFALLNQVVIPPNSETASHMLLPYRDAVSSSKVEGELTVSGMSDGRIYPLLPFVRQKMTEGGEHFFLQIIATYPVRYLLGVIRGALYLAGVPGIDSDNAAFLQQTLHADSHFIFPGPERTDTWVRQTFAGRKIPGRFRSILEFLVTPYQWLYRAGSVLVAMMLCLVAFFRPTSRVFFALSIPTGFLLYHAFTLFSVDRMAVPVVPFYSAVPLVLLIGLAFPKCLSGTEGDTLSSDEDEENGNVEHLTAKGRPRSLRSCP